MNDRHFKWILLVSLLINAALVGFMAGNAGRGFRPGPGMMGFNRAMPGPNRGGERANEQPAREALRDAFEAERPAMAKALKDLAEARDRSAAVIRADSLDSGALTQSLEEMRARSNDALASFHRSIITAAGKLDGPSRAGLARLLNRGPQTRNNPGSDMGAGMGIGPNMMGPNMMGSGGDRPPEAPQGPPPPN